MTTLYGIKNCDTVKKACQWLTEQNIPFQFHDFRQDGLKQTDLQDWIDTVGWEALLNKRSTSWRQLSEADKTDIDANKAATLMLANPTLIKRPVMEHGKTLLVGFKDSEYKKALA